MSKNITVPDSDKAGAQHNLLKVFAEKRCRCLQQTYPGYSKLEIELKLAVKLRKMLGSKHHFER